MTKLITILTFVFTITCSGQTDNGFVIKEFIKNDSLPRLNKADFKVNRDNIFEDDKYIVSKTCSGEWGGTIKFKNKKTGIEYSDNSTCPVVVNKLNNKYYVANTLAHLSGFSEILEISNPDSMTKVETSKPQNKKGKTLIRYVGDDESKSKNGTKPLVDSIGVLTLASILHNGQLYYIVTDFWKTFLVKIENGKFATIDIVSSESIWTYEPEVFTTPNKHSIIFFDNQKANGYMDIFQNKIYVVRQK